MRPARDTIVAAVAVVAMGLPAAGCGSADLVGGPDAPDPGSAAAPATATEATRSDGSQAPPAADDLGCALPLSERGIAVCDAGTDNYKAAYNEDPGVPERRTWLAMRAVVFDGERFVPAAGELAAGEARFVDDIDLATAAGSTATLTAASDDPLVEAVTMRLGPQPERFGMLLTLTRPLDDGDEVAASLMVRRGDGETGRWALAYRFDAALANAPEDSLEHNGPGGRWFVEGEPTPTNLEAGWE